MENTNMNPDLKHIAELAKQGYDTNPSVDAGVVVVNEIAQTQQLEATVASAPTILIPGFMTDTSLTETPVAPDTFEITDEDMRSVLPDLDALTYNTSAEHLRESITGYRKNLLINAGLTPEEASEAAINRLKREGKEINDNYLTENPKLGILEINKADVGAVTAQLTAEDKAKLSHVRAIRLVAVEDTELKTLKIDKVEKNKKAAFLKTIEGTLSKYSVPLPIYGDYVTFKGAQIIQLMSTVKYEDESFDELINKKASLIYDRLFGGTIINKYGENNKINMSYTEFANSFKFHDIDMALFGILVASSMEEVESSLTCSQCKERFPWKYNLKTLLRLDNISDQFKGIIDTILANKYDNDILKKYNDEANKVKRYKSPFTENVYDIAYPSVARAIKIYQAIDQNDPTMVYLSTLGVFLQNMFVFNTKSESYVEIEEDEIKTLMEVMQTLPQQDLDMLFTQIKDMLYSPEFILESKCPICGHNMRNDLTVDDLVFLKAQDTSVEMR